MTDTPERTDTITLELKDLDSGEVMWSSQLVWKGGERAVSQEAPPIDLDDPKQTSIEIRNVVWHPAFKALQNEFAPVKSADAAGAGGLDVAKFAWDIIKNSKPVTRTSGAFTAVLSTGDKNWDHYASAREFNSPKYDFSGKNIFGMTLFKATHSLKGTHKAAYSGKSTDVPKGQYLPLIFFDIPDAFAALTWSLTGGGSASNPSNMGSGDDVVPMVYVAAKFTADGWFQSFSKSFTYKVRGDTGYAKV
jgi:hypothetical protein